MVKASGSFHCVRELSVIFFFGESSLNILKHSVGTQQRYTHTIAQCHLFSTLWMLPRSLVDQVKHIEKFKKRGHKIVNQFPCFGTVLLSILSVRERLQDF